MQDGTHIQSPYKHPKSRKSGVIDGKQTSSPSAGSNACKRLLTSEALHYQFQWLVQRKSISFKSF